MKNRVGNNGKARSPKQGIINLTVSRVSCGYSYNPLVAVIAAAGQAARCQQVPPGWVWKTLENKMWESR